MIGMLTLTLYIYDAKAAIVLSLYLSNLPTFVDQYPALWKSVYLSSQIKSFCEAMQKPALPPFRVRWASGSVRWASYPF